MSGRIASLVGAFLAISLLIFSPAQKVSGQITQPECIGTATLSWIESTEGTDGLPLVDPITGFTIYIGLDPSDFPETRSLPNGIATFVVDGLCDGTHYFVMTATNVIGESAFSNVGSKTITGGGPFPEPDPDPVRTVPGAAVLDVQ